MEDLTILVVEDNPMNMKLVKGLLEQHRCAVLESNDAKTGIRLAREHVPDLVLMDIQLPGMDGFSATQIIKNDPALKDIPVVALTAHAMRGDEQKAREVGCDGYIVKPIDTRHFLENITQIIQGNTDRGKCPRGTNHKTRVLIVDDEPLNTKLLAAKMPPDEFEIMSASSGAEALEAVNQELPDLILMDTVMPDMDGYEVTKRLKNNPETEFIPVIMITALDGKEDKERALEAGIDEFINKPVNGIEFMTRINSVRRLAQFREQLEIRRLSEEPLADPYSLEMPAQGEGSISTVLVVEDNEQDAKLVQSYLKDQPYRLVFTRDGEEALSRAPQEKIDLIVLDASLPGMDGFETCRRLKEIPQTRNTPMVVVVGLQDLENDNRGIELGVDDYLLKPINSRELRARVNILLKKKAYIDALHARHETASHSPFGDVATGLYNGRYLERFLEIEVKRSERYGYPVGLAVVDIDDSRRHADRLGHPTGEVIMRELAEVIKGNIREVDLAARHRDDEIVIVFPYCCREEVKAIVERVRRAFASHSPSGGDSASQCSVTFSVGIALYPADAGSKDELLLTAEKMLQKAKKEGKNRICAYG